MGFLDDLESIADPTSNLTSKQRTPRHKKRRVGADGKVEKLCGRCNQFKNRVANFYTRKSKSPLGAGDGFQNVCIDCMRDDAKKRWRTKGGK